MMMNPKQVLADFRDELRAHVSEPGPVIQGFWVQGKPMAMLSSLEDITDDAASLSAAFMQVFNDVIEEAEANADVLAEAGQVQKILTELGADDAAAPPQTATVDNVVPISARR